MRCQALVRRRRRREGALAMGLVLAVAGAATVVVPSAHAQGARDATSSRMGQSPGPERPPDRSRELLDLRCTSEIGLRQVTLFANGTVRVREGLGQDPRMTLGELAPEVLAGYLRRLADEDLSEVHDEQSNSASGAWVERCTLRLALDDRPPRELRFARYDSLPLQLAALVRVADEVAGHARPLDNLPFRYQARTGDVLRRADGILFEVRGFTTDKQGLELQGVEQPLIVYVRPEDLRTQFIELVSRRMP